MVIRYAATANQKIDGYTRKDKTMVKKKNNIMLIETAKRFTVGDIVQNLDVVITTAGATKQVDESLPIKQGKQDWIQKLGLTDSSGHIWAKLPSTSYNPRIKGRELIIKEAEIDEFTDKGGQQKKMLIIRKWEEPVGPSEPEPPKRKAEGVIDPLVENILHKYEIDAIDALWPCTRHNKRTNETTTNWIIYHRYCEQIAARAGIVFEPPELIENDNESGRVVLLVKGRLGYAEEWSYGEAAPSNCVVPYIFAMAEKRAKDRVILKLAGFHGMVYSDVEENWSNEK